MQRLQLTTQAPVWEGLVLPGIERGDPRIQVFAAEPVSELKPFIQSLWFMDWNIPHGIEIDSIVVPTVCCHLMGLYVPAFSPSPLWHAFLTVKTKGEFRYLKGRGQSFGVEFRPGGLFPFLQESMREWDNGMLPLQEMFPQAPPSPLCLLTPESVELWLSAFESFLLNRLAIHQANHLPEITAAIDIMLTEDVQQIDDLLSDLPVSKRTLQRIFQTEVGVSPRDTLRIVRFHKAIKAINTNNPECLANFALASGFFDQSHMNNEFRKMVETNPTQFRTYW